MITVISICRTPGCPNEGIEIVSNPEVVPVGIYCGPCKTEVTDIEVTNGS